MIELIEPDWPAPANIRAFCTTRVGGVSEGAYASLNLAGHVGDDPGRVERNRTLLAGLLPSDTEIQWLTQVHGNGVVHAPTEAAAKADACWTETLGVATAVLTADCLPVLFCNFEGTLVAAAHAGWRGLAAGVLEATVAALPVPASELMAWLGPAIGADAYEVGPEVRAAFLAAAESDGSPPASDVASAFLPSRPREGHFFADLYRLARLRLEAAGVVAIHGGNYCTFTENSRFFSHRRDGQTGRMASLICINPG